MIEWDKVREQFHIGNSVSLVQGKIGRISLQVHEAKRAWENLEYCHFGPSGYLISKRFHHGLDLDPEIPASYYLSDWRGVHQLKANIATQLGANPQEVFFTFNTTEAMEAALWMPRWNKGDGLVTTDAEYGSIYKVIEQIELSRGINVRLVDIISLLNDPDFEEKCVSSIAARVDHRTKAVVFSDILRSCGATLPVQRISRACKAINPNTLVVLDGAQSFGHIPVNVKESGVDAYTSAGHKWLGAPIGSGILFVKEELSQSGDFYLNELLTHFWEEEDTDVAELTEYTGVCSDTLVGLNTAMELYQSLGAENVQRRNSYLASLARQRLVKIPGLELFPKQVVGTPNGIVSFRLRGIETFGEAKKAGEHLTERGVDISPIHTPVLVRACFHVYNNEGDIERLCQELMRLV